MVNLSVWLFYGIWYDNLFIYYVFPEIFTEINHLAYWDLYEVKVVTQLVKIIYSKTPLNPKKGKGKPEKGSGAVTKKGRVSVGGNRGFVSIKFIS